MGNPKILSTSSNKFTSLSHSIKIRSCLNIFFLNFGDICIKIFKDNVVNIKHWRCHQKMMTQHSSPVTDTVFREYLTLLEPLMSSIPKSVRVYYCLYTLWNFPSQRDILDFFRLFDFWNFSKFFIFSNIFHFIKLDVYSLSCWT